MLQSEVIPSLQTIEGKLKDELLNVREYRAVLSIDKIISEMPELDDVVPSLGLIKEKLKDRLKEVREYRALVAIEKSIAEVHDLLADAGSAAQQPVGIPAVVPASFETAPAAVMPESAPFASVLDANVSEKEHFGAGGEEPDTLDTARVA